MLAFEVSPHFLASSLLGAVSQRLVRTFCPHCRFPIEGEDAATKSPEGGRKARYSALGCPICHQTGFVGRTGVFEILEATPGVRDLIQAREPAPVIEALAYREGMPGLYQAARELVAAGRTEWSEVARVLPPETQNRDAEPGNRGPSGRGD